MTKPRMSAVQYDSYGPPAVLHAVRAPIPELRAGHVLVRAAASSVNGADVEVRAGHLRVLSGRKFPRGTGFDFAGDVVAVADDVTGYRVGDGVWGSNTNLKAGPTAAAAEYVLASTKDVSRRPRSLDASDAAALPGAAGAALATLQKVGLQAGERILVRGGAGGVGSAAVQLAAARGGQVTALVRGTHLHRVRELGAHEAFDYTTISPKELGEFDVIIDPVGRNLRAYRSLLRPGGRMAAMIAKGPGQFAYIAASTIHGKRRVRFVQSPPNGKVLAELAALVDDKSIVPVIDSVYSLDDAAAAHRSVEAGGGFGKRVIRSA